MGALDAVPPSYVSHHIFHIPGICQTWFSTPSVTYFRYMARGGQAYGEAEPLCTRQICRLPGRRGLENPKAHAAFGPGIPVLMRHIRVDVEGIPLLKVVDFSPDGNLHGAL